jgi:hypothetical protein
MRIWSQMEYVESDESELRRGELFWYPAQFGSVGSDFAWIGIQAQLWFLEHVNRIAAVSGMGHMYSPGDATE